MSAQWTDYEQLRLAEDEWNRNYTVTGFHKQSASVAVPAVRGFVRSPFNPLIYHSVKQAAEEAGIVGGLPSERKGIVLGSLFADAVTEEETWKDLIQGKKLSPIMFPQSVPSSVIGFLAKELGIHGPMSCMGAYRSGLQLLLQQAIDWIEDDEADAVIVTCCDTPSIRAKLWAQHFLGNSRLFGGGVVSFVVETRTFSAGRGRESALSIAELLALNETGAKDRFHGMAFGVD